MLHCWANWDGGLCLVQIRYMGDDILNIRFQNGGGDDFLLGPLIVRGINLLNRRTVP